MESAPLWPSLTAFAVEPGLRRLTPDAEVARNPARRLGYVSCVGWRTSYKMGLRFPYESLAERDAMVLLDVDPAVRTFHAQPETFQWVQGGRRRRYTPDLLVEHGDGRLEYREVKPDHRRRKDPLLDGRWPWIEAECARRGAAFEFWTEATVRREPRLSNAKRLRAGVGHLNAASIARIRGAVARVGLPSPLGRLVEAANGGPGDGEAILGMAGLGYLALDLERQLGPDTLVAWGWRE